MAVSMAAPDFAGAVRAARPVFVSESAALARSNVAIPDFAGVARLLARSDVAISVAASDLAGAARAARPGFASASAPVPDLAAPARATGASSAAASDLTGAARPALAAASTPAPGPAGAALDLGAVARSRLDPAPDLGAVAAGALSDVDPVTRGAGLDFAPAFPFPAGAPLLALADAAGGFAFPAGLAPFPTTFAPEALAAFLFFVSAIRGAPLAAPPHRVNRNATLCPPPTFEAVTLTAASR